ncbi:glycosyl transferase group 1 [Paludibacter propionicigenes WB4]|uniref:Glycosyl transferase group 1 n=1 Tax=Paludibacter propionicigenes (strain DSM 17365 / JCM 13257 / WB4) TaxID=694427 RepID=E4T2L6_PALPW|nr:glycosyltransferase family 4 protein [Paludibacter propionicigenes]ADQ78960.1 glycosyl transferase group 1 [Paludibacter propionicigenes WB4]
MKPTLTKVLFLSQWYPHRNDQMFGLFVQKHAEAASLFCQIKVLYVQSDASITDFETEIKEQNNLSEIIVYYPAKKQNLLSKILNTINYYRAYWKGYKIIYSDDFKPDIIHANILTRTACVAYIFKLLKGIPYVITEHWSRYLPARDSFNGTLRKLVTRIVVSNADAILPVSENLKQAMQSHKLLNNNYIVVNNVVDNSFFTESTVIHRSKKRIIHVSCFDEEAKNIKGIISATFELSRQREDFELMLIGTGIDFEIVKKYADTLDFQKDVIHFLGEKTPKEVANWMQNSDFLILFSNFETAGVVIAESLACGKPVISTCVGIAPECIDESNGILLSTNTESELVEKMNYLLDNFQSYDANLIKADAKNKFSYAHIGKQLSTIYEKSILRK